MIQSFPKVEVCMIYILEVNKFSTLFNLQTEEIQVRRCSPFLESTLLSEDSGVSAEWKAIPDIWRYTAEKFGDRVALVDPYHDPPTTMTYKQVRFLPYISSLGTLLFILQSITSIIQYTAISGYILGQHHFAFNLKLGNASQM